METDGRKMELVSQEYFDDLRAVLKKDCAMYDKTLECYQLGQFYEYRDKNFAEAEKIYARLCDKRGHGSSCLSAGMIALNGRGRFDDKKGASDTPSAPMESPSTPSNGQCALERFLQACKLGEPKGCQNAGLLKKSGGHGVEKNVPEALSLFEQACDGLEPNGCFYMGVMHLTGWEGQEPDKMKALKYSGMACDMGHPWGCINAARLCMLGEGVPKDDAAAKRYKEQAMRIRQGETR